MNTIDKILLTCAIFLLLFTVTMIVIFCIFQSIPDSLVDSVYGLFSCEAVVTMVIWWVKKKANKKEANNGETKKP